MVSSWGTLQRGLCEELQGADLLSDTELQDLLEDVLSLTLLHDSHSLQLSIGQPHQSSACDIVLFEGVTVDLVLVGAVLLQPLTHVLLGP